MTNPCAMLLKFFWWCICLFLWVQCTVHRTCKSLIYANFSLKLDLTVLFTNLKIILLKCFQFSIFSNKRYPNRPIIFSFFLRLEFFLYFGEKNFNGPRKKISKPINFFFPLLLPTKHPIKIFSLFFFFFFFFLFHLQPNRF